MPAFDASAIVAALVASGRHVFARDGRLVVEGPPLCSADRAVLRAAKPELLRVLAGASDCESNATRGIPGGYPSTTAQMGQGSGPGGRG